MTTTYFSIFIPNKLDTSENDQPLVFPDFNEALKVLKLHKDGRLKTFKNNEEAINYSETGYEIIPKLPDLKSPSATAEKAAFRAPTKQELIQFRKAIEEGNYDKVKKIISDNPRYLVNSGDTPTSLKDGYRYNALHICAINKKAKIAELILKTISTIEFIDLLHGKKNSKTSQEVCEILLEYYLNMPEKGRSETPLHLAVKYGAIEVVEILTKYPQCKMSLNLENMLPKDIICGRMDNPPEDLKEKIANLLEDRFYVPVIRSIDNSIPPVIGQPFSPKNVPDLNMDPLSPEVEIQAYAGPMTKEQAQIFRKRWKTPPRISSSSTSNNVNIFNSPASSPVKQCLSTSTPTKSTFNVNNSLLSYLRKPLFSDRLETNEDSENGNGTIEPPNPEDTFNNNGQNATNDESQNNISKEITKELLHNEKVQSLTPQQVDHIAKIIQPSFPILTPLKRDPKKRDLFFTYRERAGSPINDSIASLNTTCGFSPMAIEELNVKLTDPEKGLEVLGRELAKEQQIEWREYWDFLECFIDISSEQGLEKFEIFLTKRKQKDGKDIKNVNEELMNNLCNALNQLGRNNLDEKSYGDSNEIVGKTTKHFQQQHQQQQQSSPSTTPYLCIEKSLQVFAKRLTKTILINIDKITSLNDAFLSELKKLKSLICSFKYDQRFLNVDFTFVHSRFANLISNYLKTSQEIDNPKLNKIRQNFQTILQSSVKVLDNKDSTFRYGGSLEKKEQLQCVTKLILEYISEPELGVQPENLKTESICLQTWFTEIKCLCIWNSSESRHAFRKKRFESSETARRLFDYPSDIQKSDPSEISHVTQNNLWNYRNNINLENIENSDDDDDVFLSDIDSDEEDRYYTPPESPSMLNLDLPNDDYDIYVLGNEPTKRDLDVINAIFHVDISNERYPNIYLWKTAILKYSNEEKDGFPSPSVIKKCSNDVKANESNIVHRIGFGSSKAAFSKYSSSKPTQNENSLNDRFVSYNKENASYSSSPITSKSLSFLNVSL